MNDPEIYRFLCDDGVVEISLPSPYCISPKSKEQIEGQLDLIKGLMARGVVEHANRLATIKQTAAEDGAVTFEEPAGAKAAG